MCVANAESLSVNIDVPTLAYETSVERHIRLLSDAIADPFWNQSELVREFRNHWGRLCELANTHRDALYFVGGTKRVDGAEIRTPDRASGGALVRCHLGLTHQVINAGGFEAIRGYARWSARSKSGKAILLRCASLMPAPRSMDELLSWYLRTMQLLDEESHAALRRFRRHPGRSYWLVVTADVRDGPTWLAMHLQSATERRLPLTESDARNWRIAPYDVRSLSRTSLVPRGGGSLDISGRRVLLVGCGSVGGELAQRLTSAGVEHLKISDPDVFAETNLYRHTLSILDLGFLKSSAVALGLAAKHPWATVVDLDARLEDLRDKEELGTFDLIVIAVGSPTSERVFREYCRAERVDVPCINCWVEAYGVGGHAILDIPGSKGCWHCAYVDPVTGGRGLASNLNFLAANQNLALTHEGCGFQFLPYSGIAASYTATMAADLAVRFLSGGVRESSKVSWRGSPAAAIERGFRLTRRFREFEESLAVLPLHNDECDLCGS